MTEDTILMRQINPAFLVDGRVSSAAFHPTPKDEGRLSVYDGDLINAQDSWNHFTAAQGYKSAGVQGVSVAECNAEGLPTESDTEAFDEHAVIDFNGLETKGAVRRKSKSLRDYAIKRNWLFIGL